MTIELLAVAIGALNGFILLVKPIGRLHTRLDLIEYRLGDVERHLAKRSSLGYDEDAR
jgi:hypothetical protein